MADNTTTLSIILSAQDKLSSVLGSIKNAFGDFGGGIDGAKKDLNGLAKEGASTSKALALVGGVAAGAVAVGVGAIGVASVKAAASFQSGMLVMQTSAGESASNMNKVSKGVLQIASSVGESAQSLVGPDGPLYQIESAGFHGAQGLEVLRAATQGARAEGANMTKVADAVSSALIDYHLPATSAADVTSKLVAAVGAGKANFEQFTGALHSVLPIASAMHVPLNDILGDMASMTQHGMSADQATQNLAHSLLKLQSPTTEMTSELGSLGINSAQLSSMLSEKGLSGTMNYISDTVMTKLGGKATMLISAFNGNKMQAQDLMNMYSAMPASLQKVADAYEKGGMSVGDYRNTIKSLPADQANLVQQYVALANKAHGFSQIVKSGKNPLQDYSQAMQAATGDATTLSTALMISGENEKNTARAVNAVAKAHADAKGQVQGFALWQDTLNGKMAIAKSTISNAGIALGTAFLPPLTSLLKTVINIISPIVGWINTHQKLAAIILGSIVVIATLTATILTAYAAFKKISGAVTIIKDIGKAIDLSFATNPVFLVIAAVVALGIIFYELYEHVKPFRDFVNDMWKDIKHWFEDGVNFIKDHWRGILAILIAPISPALAIWIMFHKQIKQAFTDTIHAIVAIWNGIVAGVRKAVSTAAKVVLGIWDAIKGPLRAIGIVILAILLLPLVPFALAWKRFGKDFIQAWQSVVSVIQSISLAMISFFSTVIQGIETVFKAIVGFIVGIFKSEWNAVVTVWNGVVSFFRWVVNMAKQPFNDVVGFISGIFRQAWNAIVSVFSAMNNFVYNYIKMPILNAVKDAGNWLFDVGKNIIQGLINGVTNMAGKAEDAVKNVGKGLESTAKKILGVFSPSRVFNEIGQNVSLGMAQGITQASTEVNKATNTIVPTMKFQGNTLVAGTVTNPNTTRTPLTSGSIPSSTAPTAQTGTSGPNITLNVNVGAYAGQPGELNQLATTIWQQIMVVARQHNLAGNLPNIGVRPI